MRAIGTAGLGATGVAPFQGLRRLFPGITRPTPIQSWAETVASPPGPVLAVIEEETPCAPREGLPRRAAVARVPDAGAAAEAARSAGATVCLRRAREVVDEATMRKAEGWLENAGHQNTLFEALTTEGAEWADAILFGTPSYSGAVSTELKA